ncbi:uncharacterized protein BJ171DRAFT_594803 [Polychytrium aggregatum]|uniref:uncharacterized protein n=1 Tax=Polychytrium aggregatum TaxID=110093 RepID=UPI0022FEBB88|nr:uncharacterized protein BJ171DRAFT_594803 [Polychytrium aggregatum]KAI9209786.1 hypothetical protein BJ171DRAFT_594803 [Polychytrium aggregatum]
MGPPNPQTQWSLSLGLNFMILSLCISAATKLIAHQLHRKFIFKIVWLDIGILILSSILVIITITGLLNQNDVMQYEYIIAAYISMESFSLYLGIIESTDRFCALISNQRTRKIIKAASWTFFGLCCAFNLLSEFIGIWGIYHSFFAFSSTPYYINILNPFLSFYYNAYIAIASFMDLHFLVKLGQGIRIRFESIRKGKERFIVYEHILWVILCLVSSIVAFCVNIAAGVTGTYTFSDHLNSLTHAYRLNVFIDFGVHIHDLLSSDIKFSTTDSQRSMSASVTAKTANINKPPTTPKAQRTAEITAI